VSYSIGVSAILRVALLDSAWRFTERFDPA